MAKTKIPKGWRKLEPGEIIKRGDKYGWGGKLIADVKKTIGEQFKPRFGKDDWMHVPHYRPVPAKKKPAAKPSKKKSLKPSPILFSQEDFEENLTVARKKRKG